MPKHQKAFSEKSLQKRIKTLQRLNKIPLIPWKLKRVFHHFLFPPHTEVLQQPFSSRPILFIAPNIPFPDRGGTDYRLLHLLKGTLKAGYAISFFSLYERDLLAGRIEKTSTFLQYETSLKELPLSHLFYGIRAFRTFLKSNPDTFSAIFIAWPKSVQATLPTIKRYAPSVPVIYDMCDYHARRLRREGELHSDPRILARAKEFQVIESEAARSTNLTLVISAEEKELFLSDNPSVNIDVLGNFFDFKDQSVPGPEERTGILFVGSFVHPPNRDGVLWFVREIYPLIKQKLPCIPFHVVGIDPPSEIREFSYKDPDIHVHGWVPDLSGLFRSTRVFVAPLRYGAGVKGKVGLAMSKGLPVVTTSIGAEGMDLTSETNCEISDSPEDFARKTIRLLSDTEHWCRISDQAQRHALKNSSTDDLPEKMRQIFETVGAVSSQRH
jgi:glycosyltransferase involved in cell wall biosynthesis